VDTYLEDGDEGCEDRGDSFLLLLRGTSSSMKKSLFFFVSCNARDLITTA
jgi:hypothetical protein